MQMHALSLQQFRSYTKETFQFSPSVTLVIGPNTAGKTNILEAIFCLATGKSFRAERESDMVQWGEEIARIRATANQTNPTNLTNQTNKLDKLENDEMLLELVITTGEVNGEKTPTKKYLVNGVPRRQIDFVGNLRAVLFSPEDLDLITDSPSLRRNFLNSILIQTDREYRRNLYSYERGLRQRNKLLDLINEGKAHRSQLLFWNQLLIASGTYITQKRQELIEYINNQKTEDGRRKTEDGRQKTEDRERKTENGKEKIKFDYQIVYDKSVISESRLEQYKDEEVAAKTTLVGPQRDDFVVTKSQNSNLNDQQGMCRDVSRFGSRGEQRLAVLWLKLAELSYIESQTGERPILLLDDIFSELDSESRELVLSIIYMQQTIITSAEEIIVEIFEKKENIKVIRLPIL